MPFLFLNGTVLTMENPAATHTACAVNEGRIVGVGPEKDMRSLLGDGAEEIDLGGGVLLPGFTDCHIHFVLSAYFKMNLDLIQVTSVGHLLSTIRDAARDTPPGKWVLGLRFREDDYPENRPPTLDEIDSASPDHPVLLIRYDGHSAVANSRALALAGITRDTPNPEGGVIERTDGRPTGVLREMAVKSVFSALPTPEPEEFKTGLDMMIQRMLSCGIVGMNNVLMTSEGGLSGALGPFEVPIFKMFEADIPLRHYPLVAADSVDDAVRILCDDFGAVERSGRLRGGALKLFADGTFGSRTAYFSEDYADAPGERGFMVNRIEDLRDTIFTAHERGLQTVTHTIGDLAVSDLAGVYAQAVERFGKRGLRHRLEHVGLVPPAAVETMKSAGLIASMQPNFIVSEGSWMHTRVGRRLDRVYPMRSLLDAGVPLCAGSDSPIEDPHVMSGVWGVAARNGFTPDQALTPYEALDLYTRGASYACFSEDVAGTITPGKNADLVVLKQNPLAVDTDQIRDIEVGMTMIGGKVYYEG